MYRRPSLRAHEETWASLPLPFPLTAHKRRHTYGTASAVRMCWCCAVRYGAERYCAVAQHNTAAQCCVPHNLAPFAGVAMQRPPSVSRAAVHSGSDVPIFCVTQHLRASPMVGHDGYLPPTVPVPRCQLYPGAPDGSYSREQKSCSIYLSLAGEVPAPFFSRC